MTRTAKVSVGLAAALGAERIAQLAPAIERAGFHALWVNDTPEADALAALAAAAAATERLVLATGVLPVDRRPADAIAADLERLGLPQDRLVLGVGSGAASSGAVELVGASVAALRDRVRAKIVVGALGPRMRALGAEEAGGVLLSWLTPELAARQTAQAHERAAGALAALYVRTALDERALPRLWDEASRYGSYPNYAANFARLGIDAAETVLAPDGASRRLAAYRETVDEVVLRAIVAGDDVAAYEAFVAEAAKLL